MPEESEDEDVGTIFSHLDMWGNISCIGHDK
jgi:hypothetical protein